jgi:hypothetical protein
VLLPRRERSGEGRRTRGRDEFFRVSEETRCAFGAPLGMKMGLLQRCGALNRRDLGLFSEQWGLTTSSNLLCAVTSQSLGFVADLSELAADAAVLRV